MTFYFKASKIEVRNESFTDKNQVLDTISPALENSPDVC
jgi:hypothetical protein